ncbi:MAG: outer membrane lipoprotein carrier protein LolA [Prolixibacteraceae bacterium]|nr:outer membrane lipoprotein carrier protein LolA [Prolixibacteraceae bacterium]
MKKLLFVLLFLNSINLFSQVDQKAKTILDKVSEKTNSYTSITAEFEFIMENTDAGIKETNEGRLILQKDKYQLSISGIEIFFDGKAQWTYLSDAGEVNISNPNDDEEAINPATIFTIYEKGFKNTYLGEFTNNSRKTFKIEMVPTDEKEFERIILEIGQGTYQILSAKMFGNDGNTYTINVVTLETGKSYPESTFYFDTEKYPDVDVIDMR